MFGYIKAYKPEMRIKEYEMYKAIYCSVCKQMGKQYGIISRFSLSYDFTFLTVFYLSLRSDCFSVKRGRCMYNPLKACNFVENGLPEMPLAAAEIMLYYKLLDNIEDEKFIKRFFAYILKLFSEKGHKKAAEKFPDIEKVFKDYYFKQKSIENANSFNIDEAAHPTAEMLSKVFEFVSTDDEKQHSSRLGYCLGRWIYFIDAAEDIDKDIKENKYNPLKKDYLSANNGKEFLKENLGATMNFCIAEAVNVFEEMNFCRLKDILGNVIYLGLAESQKSIFLKEKNQ